MICLIHFSFFSLGNSSHVEITGVTSTHTSWPARHSGTTQMQKKCQPRRQRLLRVSETTGARSEMERLVLRHDLEIEEQQISITVRKYCDLTEGEWLHLTGDYPVSVVFVSHFKGQSIKWVGFRLNLSGFIVEMEKMLDKSWWPMSGSKVTKWPSLSGLSADLPGMGWDWRTSQKHLILSDLFFSLFSFKDVRNSLEVPGWGEYP